MTLTFASAVANAEDIPVDSSLGESVQFVSSNRMFSVDLETTVFRPEGPGPFPVVVINHGKAFGNNHLQSRERALPAVREFLMRGYAIVLPMRQGFSKSGGAAVGDGCNIGGNGEAQAQDVRTIVAWIEKQPWADTTRMIMMGQSHGGLATLAYAQDPHPGFRLFVDFAGGLKYPDGGCQWALGMEDAFGRYGARAKMPSLWFYGENDSFFPPPVIQPAWQAYVKAGGQAELVAYGPFGVDSHGMFARQAGLPIWWPRVEARLKMADLPTEVLNPQYAPKFRIAEQTASGFAVIADVDRVPHLGPKGREAYRRFLALPPPRAFALASNGAYGWLAGDPDSLLRAVESCDQYGKGNCRPYAVDNDVVWKASP